MFSPGWEEAVSLIIRSSNRCLTSELGRGRVIFRTCIAGYVGTRDGGIRFRKASGAQGERWPADSPGSDMNPHNDNVTAVGSGMLTHSARALSHPKGNGRLHRMEAMSAGAMESGALCEMIWVAFEAEHLLAKGTSASTT